MSLRTALDPKPFDPFLYLHVLSIYPIFPRKFTIPVEPLTSHCSTMRLSTPCFTFSYRFRQNLHLCYHLLRVLSVLFGFVHPARERGDHPLEMRRDSNLEPVSSKLQNWDWLTREVDVDGTGCGGYASRQYLWSKGDRLCTQCLILTSDVGSG
jgi:hypothetical protein